jgi:hypothetical protein
MKCQSPLDGLIDYSLFYVPLKNFHSYGDIYIRHLIAGEELQNLGLCLVFRAFEQGGRLYRATPAVTQAEGLGFSGLNEGPLHSVAFYKTQD